jgi:hypothetical protein
LIVPLSLFLYHLLSPVSLIFNSLLSFCVRLQNCQKRLLTSLCLYVRLYLPHVTNWIPLDGIFITFYIWVFSESLSRKDKFDWNLTITTDILHAERCIFMIIPPLILLRMRNASDKSCRKNQNTFHVEIFFQNQAVYKILWKNMVEPERPQMTM